MSLSSFAKSTRIDSTGAMTYPSKLELLSLLPDEAHRALAQNTRLDTGHPSWPMPCLVSAEGRLMSAHTVDRRPNHAAAPVPDAASLTAAPMDLR